MVNNIKISNFEEHPSKKFFLFSRRDEYVLPNSAATINTINTGTTIEIEEDDVKMTLIKNANFNPNINILNCGEKLILQSLFVFSIKVIMKL
jgi:hypothetical protein